jgi:hypothetical protein
LEFGQYAERKLSVADTLEDWFDDVGERARGTGMFKEDEHRVIVDPTEDRQPPKYIRDDWARVAAECDESVAVVSFHQPLH